MKRQRNIIRMLPLWLMAICIASCSSSDDDNNVEPTPADTSVQARIDSIALPSDDPALFKFDYDKNKVKNYAINVRWLWTKTFGRDSVTFDYLQDRIVANMSFLKETGSWGMHAKVKRTATFYLQGGMIVAASLPLQMHETLKDSIQYYYEGGKLSKYTVCRRVLTRAHRPSRCASVAEPALGSDSGWWCKRQYPL